MNNIFKLLFSMPDPIMGYEEAMRERYKGHKPDNAKSGDPASIRARKARKKKRNHRKKYR